jgi:hypothetical protein
VAPASLTVAPVSLTVAPASLTVAPVSLTVAPASLTVAPVSLNVDTADHPRFAKPPPLRLSASAVRFSSSGRDRTQSLNLRNAQSYVSSVFPLPFYVDFPAIAP